MYQLAYGYSEINLTKQSTTILHETNSNFWILLVNYSYPMALMSNAPLLTMVDYSTQKVYVITAHVHAVLSLCPCSCRQQQHTGGQARTCQLQGTHNPAPEKES